MNEQRNPKEYVVNPYQLVAANGRYYLIANTEPHFNVSHYRVDRISDICLLETPVKDPRQVQGLEQGLDLSQHMAEHPYLFAGESVRATFRAKKHLLNDLEDWFGPAANYFHETESALDVTVKVNQEAMFYWALQYAPFVEVLEPAPCARGWAGRCGRRQEKYETEVSLTSTEKAARYCQQSEALFERWSKKNPVGESPPGTDLCPGRCGLP